MPAPRPTGAPTPPPGKPGGGARSSKATGSGRGSTPPTQPAGRSGAQTPAPGGTPESTPAPGGSSLPGFLGSPGDVLGKVKDNAPDLSALTLTPPRRLTARDAGGFLAGLAVYVFVIQYLHNGPDGVRGWFRAKFLNDPWTPPGGSSGGGGTGGSGSPSSGGLDTVRPLPPTRVPHHPSHVVNT